jgi:hypothetical protein
MTPEGRVKEACKRLLKARDIWYFMPVSNGMGRHGIPDLVCCWGGRFLSVETKAPGKISNVSALQEREINAIRAAKGLAIVVDDVSQLEELLNGEYR